MLSSPFRRFPRAQSERVFIGTIALLSLNVVSMFQSGMAGVFIKPIYYKNIDTMQQFGASQQKILIKYPAMMTDLFPEDSSALFNTLNHRMLLDPRPELTGYKVTNDMKMATVTRRITFKLSKEQDLIHLVRECPRSYNLAYLLSRHSVFLNRINAIILDIMQFGFINKWINDINYKVKLETMKIHPEESFRTRVFTIEDLQLAFFILALGISFAILTLLIEFLLNHKMFCAK
jgi:hypothetical protein